MPSWLFILASVFIAAGAPVLRAQTRMASWHDCRDRIIHAGIGKEPLGGGAVRSGPGSGSGTGSGGGEANAPPEDPPDPR